MKKAIYVVTIITIIIASLGINTPIYAKNPNLGDAIKGADNFLSNGEGRADSIISPEKIKNLTDAIYNTLLIVAIVTAVLLGTSLGIKFIMEGTEGKAEVKKALLPYTIGCIVAFGAFTIWRIVVIILQGL